MEEKIHFGYTYVSTAHALVEPINLDVWFYNQLPGREEDFDTAPDFAEDEDQSHWGPSHPEWCPPPNIEQVFTVLGSALLSSSTIATIVRAWLQSRRSKITIWIPGTDKKVEYEGPNFKQDAVQVQAIIESLAKEANSRLAIEARRLSDNMDDMVDGSGS